MIQGDIFSCGRKKEAERIVKKKRRTIGDLPRVSPTILLSLLGRVRRRASKKGGSGGPGSFH